MSTRFPRPRRELGDVMGKPKGERVSEYFDFRTWPEKADRKVTRAELLALLTNQWILQRDRQWYRRLWKYLRARVGTPKEPIGVKTKDQAGDHGTIE